MKYGIIAILVIIILLPLIFKEKGLPPENCRAERGDIVYDISMQDTVVVYSKWRGNNGDITVRNKYGERFMLKCGEYK